MQGFISQCRQHFVLAGLFSFVVNLLILAVPLYSLQVFDRVFSSRSLETLGLLTVVAVVAIVAMSAIEGVRQRLLMAAGVTLDRALGPAVIARLAEKTARGERGAEAAMSLRDVARLRGYLSGPGVIAFFDAPWALLFGWLVFLFHPFLGLTAMLGSATLFFLAWLTDRTTRPPNEAMHIHSRAAARFIDASLRNAEAVLALGMGPAVTARWAKENDKVVAAQLEAGRLSSRLQSATKSVRLLIQVAMMGVGAYLVILGDLTSGAMIASTLLLSRVLGPVEAAIGTWRSLLDARESYDNLNKGLAEGKVTRIDRTELPEARGHLTVENVVFSLQPGATPILKGVGFDLPAGESLGVLGPSAAGKSTLARLLVGVWQPSSGSVRLDGAELDHWPAEARGKALGYLPQDVELFPGTVAENIARLSVDATDDSQVVAAAQMAEVHELILRLNEGYETPVGESGQKLSGGQRQRVALARALYGSPRLIVLDEPNANLDSDGEAALVKVMAKLKLAGVTTILITHRPGLLQHLDKLLILNQGRVEAFGPRAAVLAKLNELKAQQTAGAPPGLTRPAKAAEQGGAA